jgi:hypothetical protein
MEQLKEYYGKLKELIAGCLQQNRNDQKMLYKAFYSFAMRIYVCAMLVIVTKLLKS